MRAFLSPLPSPTYWREMGATLLLALPIIAGQLLQSSLGVIDTIMVGQVSVTGVAAASFANSLFSVPMICGFGVLGAISIKVAHARGRHDYLEAAAILKRGLVMGLGVAGLLAALITLLCGHLDGFHEAPDVTAQARGFLLILIWSLVPVYLVQALKQYSEALGHPTQPMFILAGGMVMNIGLNWLLIYGHGGFPALGLLGAGWATLATRTAMCLAMAFYVWKRLLPRATSAAEAKPLFQWQPYREMLALGLPVGLQLILEVGAFSTVAIMMGWVSKEALAAHQITVSLTSNFFMVPLGIMMALVIRISHAVGSGSRELPRCLALGALHLAAIFLALMGVVIFLFGHVFAAAFVHDPAVIALAGRILLVAAFLQFFDGIQVIAMGALRGLHDVAVPTLMNLGAYWLIGLPLAFALAFRWGVEAPGIWLGLTAGITLVTFLLLGRLHRQLGKIESGPPLPVVPEELADVV